MWQVILKLTSRLRKPGYLFAVIVAILLFAFAGKAFLKGGSLSLFSVIFQNSFNKDSHDTFSLVKLSPKGGHSPGKEKVEVVKKPKPIVQNDNAQEKKPAVAENNVAEAVQDKNNQIIWQKNIETNVLTWTAAQEYCKNLGLGGYDDWRLPTISELESLVDKRYSPPINPLFGTLPVSYLPYFWSSTIEPNDHKEAQFLNFKNGLPAHINKEKGYGFARCVRHG